MIRRALASLVLCLILLFAGIYLGGHPSGLPGFLRDPLVGDQDTRVVKEAIDQVHDTYYREYGKGDLSDRAISGIVASLNDRFSNYFNPKDYAKFKLQQSGEFAGIGVQVTKDAAGLKIVKVYDDSPAKDAKLAAGDIIVAVAGKPLAGRSQDASVALIQGRLGTSVKMTVRHGAKGAPRDVELTRSNIEVPVVSSSEKTVDGRKLGVISLAQFY
jgi:carboxyl-terminal processing protease